MRIDQKPPTFFTLAKAKEYAKTLAEGEKDGWVYHVIEYLKYDEFFGVIAVYDFDGEYLGSF